MQKKVLASLLVAPMAFSAMADINLGLLENPTGWESTGITGDYPIFTGGEGNYAATAVIGTGVLKQTLPSLPKGTYRVSLQNADNVQISATVGNAAPVVNGSSEIEFTVTAPEADVTIQIFAVDQSQTFSFANPAIDLVYDFDARKSALETLLNGVPALQEVDADDHSAVAEDLRKQLADLQSEIASIQADINRVGSEQTLDTYKEFELFNTPDKIESAITALTGKVTGYNEAVAAEKATYATIQANTAAHAALLQEVTDLRAALKVETDKIDAASEYVKGQCSPDATAISSDIDSYEASIKAAYADLSKPVSFDSRKDAISADITDLAAKIAAAVADEAAYNEFQAKKAELMNEFDQASTIVAGLQGVEGSTDIYNDEIAGWMKTINDTYNDTMNGFGIKTGEITGAAALVADDVAAAEKAIETIKGVLESAQALVKAQNEAIVAAREAYGEVADRFSGILHKAVPAQYVAEYQQRIADIQDALSAVRQNIEDEYVKHDLTAEDYQDALAAIGTQIDSLEDFLSHVTPLIDLTYDLAALRAYVLDYSSKADLKDAEGKSIVDIYAKFQGTFTSLQGAIDDLNLESSEQDIKDVKDAIADEKVNATKLVDMFEAANKGVKAFSLDLSGLQTVVDGKTIIEGSTYNKSTFLNGTFKTLSEALAGFNNDLTAAAALDAQKCYDAAKALHESLEQYAAADKVEAATAEFEKDATEANYKVATDLLASVKASHADGTYFGQADVDFTAVDTEVDKIGSDITSAEATTPCPVDTFTAIDSAIEEVIQAINGVQDGINALKDNQNAYDALVALASPALDDALADLIAHNNATSLTPAREYYDNLIQGASNDSSLKAQTAALMEAIDKALTDKKAVELTSQLTGEINAMLQTIAKTKNDITLNENAHNSQLASSDEVRNYISDLLETIDNAVSESGADPDMVADWTGTLNDLLNEGTLNEDGSVAVNGLVPVDRDVTKAYGEGASNANDSRFQAAYQQILDAAKGVASAFDSEYGDRIIETNANTTGSWSDNWIPAMNDEYRAAINEYNSYTYGIHNTGYREAILPVLKTHEDIYQYSARITQIVSDFNLWLKAQNDGRHVITAEEYSAQVKVATDLIAEIEGKVNLMVQQVNAAAKVYYNGLYSQCWSAINDARTALTAAGVSADNVTAALAVANGHLSGAETLFVQAETANPGNVILPMDAVADQLDQVKPAIDLQTALLGQWNQSYGEASTELSALVEELNSYKKADDTLKAGNLDKLNAIIGQAADLNATATADTHLIDNLRQDLADLANLLTQARDLVAEVKASNDANVAEDQALADYTAQIEDLNALYNELAEYVNSMAGTGDVDLEAVRNAIDNVDNLVKTHEGHLVANKDLIDGAINTAKGQIETTYGYTFQYEKAALESLLSDTKVAFNDAKVNSKTLSAEELETLNDEIDLLAGRISTELLNQGAATDKETFRTSALDIEQKLSAIYVKLMSSYTIEDSESGDVVSGGNPLPGILADLDSQYNTVAEAIAAGQAALNATSEEAKAELGDKLATFTSRYEALRQALDNEKAGWEAEGDVIVLSQGRYAEAMDNLLKQVNTLDSEVKAAAKAAQDEADRKAASDARYETLAAGLQSYQDTLDALRQTAADFGITSWDGILDNIQEFIDNARTDLDSKKAAFTLTDSSELLNEAYISGQLTSATAGIHRQYTSTEISKVNADLTAATEALSGNIVPSVKAELTQQLAVLKDRFQSLNDSFNATGFNGNADELHSYIVILEGFRTAAATIAEEAQAISSTAADNRFTPGDVNLEPDGVVTVADVQMVINWVGEGVTYAELAQESPRQAAAADINGDQELNIADITAIIRLALDDNDSEAEATQAAPRLAIARGVRASGNVMGAAVIAENDGVRTYALMLNNTDAFVGGQIDIILPSGMEIVSATLTDRAPGHDLYMFDNAQGARLIVASLSNGEIRGNEGALVLVEVRGHGVLSTDNVVFADKASTAMKVGKADTSLIESIYNGVENAKETIYNVAGQMMRSAQRGINIIRHSDGSTTKEMR